MIIYNKQNGQIALLITLVILVAILSIGLGLTLVTIREMKMASNIEESAKSFAAADAGTEYALWETNKGDPANLSNFECGTGVYSVGEAECCFELTGNEIKSTGKFENTKRAILGEKGGGGGGTLFYGGIPNWYDDHFYSVHSDGTHIYAAGDAAGDGLIVKFNPDLSIVAGKVYGGGFKSLYSDGTHIYAAGDAAGDGLIVKFNPDLSIVAGKVYGGSGSDGFSALYSDGTHIYAAGHTPQLEDSHMADALIVKFNPDLSIVAGKVYGGGSPDTFNSLYSDGTYIYAAGFSDSEGIGNYDALIVKFNSDLEIVAKKIYGGGLRDYFYSVYSDGTYIYAVGLTNSEGAGNYDALIVKFNSDLEIVAKKIYGGGSSDFFNSVYSDGTHIYAVGRSSSEGSGYQDALIVKFNSDLEIVAKKIYGGESSDFFNSVYSDGTYIYAAGHFYPDQYSDYYDALIVKFPKSLSMESCSPLILQDSGLILQDSGLILQDSGLILQDSGLILQDSDLTPEDSELTVTGCLPQPTTSFKEVRP